MQKPFSFLAAIALTVFAANVAHAQATFFGANLDVAQEQASLTNPLNGSPNLFGTGFGTIEILGPSSLRINLNASGMSSNVTAAHIHRGAPGLTGAIVLDLAGGTGTNSITVSDVLFTDAAVNRPALSQTIAELQSGTPFYFNVHTTQNPATGELRGNISAVTVPEPATALLFAGAALPIVGLVRRNRRAARNLTTL
ncbi:MAG: CHRD domain-containing protein [Akkermansiaceae bacterium]|nr:CHRD domain-containing protein [Armatimonadota bacterium]